jgi:hypothetical protein
LARGGPALAVIGWRLTLLANGAFKACRSSPHPHYRGGGRAGDP